MSTEPSQSTALAVLPPLAIERGIEAHAWNALKQIYGDPSNESLALALDYCKARKFDPLKKPVHIVKVWSEKRGCMVETIWPSITEVRATAMRTNEYAGRDETVFGPLLKQTIGNLKETAIAMDFPEWAQVTVYRIVAGVRCAFHGPKVFWLETYSSKKGSKDTAPNSMWASRAFGQLDKCAEAAALRVAFPEETGGQQTAEEMDGKVIRGEDDDPQAGAAARIKARMKKGVAGARNVTPEPTPEPAVALLTPLEKAEKDVEAKRQADEKAKAEAEAKAKAEAEEKARKEAEKKDLGIAEPKPFVAEIVAITRDCAQYKGTPYSAIDLKSETYSGRAFYGGPADSIPAEGTQVEITLQDNPSSKRPGETVKIITHLKSAE